MQNQPGTNAKPRRIIEHRRTDPNAPRRPMTAYMCFLKEIRPKLCKDFPDAAMCKITALAADRWRKLPEEVKKPYMEKAIRLKVKYDEDIIKYKTCKKGVKEEKSNDKNVKIETKKKVCGFFAYVKERRRTLKEVDGSNRSAVIIKKIAEEWKSMNDNDKKRFMLVEETNDELDECEESIPEIKIKPLMILQKEPIPKVSIIKLLLKNHPN